MCTEQNELPPVIQPEGGRHDSIVERLQTIKKVAESINAEIPEQFEDDQHFWFLVTSEYHFQRVHLKDFFKERGVNLPLAVKRELAMITAMRHAEEVYQLQEKQAIDPLTGAWARGALDNRILTIQKWLMSTEAYLGKSDSIAVLYFLDIDKFKEFNDQWGHNVGDVFLKKLVELLELYSRGSVDMVAKYGGEEFVVLKTMSLKKLSNAFPDQPIKEVIQQQAETFRQKIVEGLSIMHEGKKLSATISMGVVNVEADEASLSSIYARASKAMKAAKDAGRNKSFSEEEGEIILDPNFPGQ